LPAKYTTAQKVIVVLTKLSEKLLLFEHICSEVSMQKNRFDIFQRTAQVKNNEIVLLRTKIIAKNVKVIRTKVVITKSSGPKL
jgi:hypothetical protein